MEYLLVQARVVDGRRKARQLMNTAGGSSFLDSVVQRWRPDWNSVYPGSLNLILERPILLQAHHAFNYKVGLRGELCLTRISGCDCLGFRPRHAPGHVLEIWSPIHLRSELSLGTGDSVSVEFINVYTKKNDVLRKMVWYVLWWGRQDWYYTADTYVKRIAKLQRLLNNIGAFGNA